MKFIKKIKSNKGVSLTDVITGIIIMMILGGIIPTMLYNLYHHVYMVRLNAIAINHAVTILEDIDRLPYEEIDNDFLIENDYNLQEIFKTTINVEKYSEENPDKEDIIKTITLTINYSTQGETESITIKKLKIKEI